MSENDKGFTVNDRRMFNVDGSQAESEAAQPEQTQSEQAPPKQAQPQAAAAQSQKPAASDDACQQELDSGTYRDLPPVAFGTFIISLAHAAMMHMGYVEDPQGNPVDCNLDLARHTIDTLAMLKEKTAGNLDKEEDSLLTGVLTELRMLYVQTCKN